MRNIKGSGDGTRPTTDGGADNIGAGEKFTGHKTVAGEELAGPAPSERMQGKRSDAAGTKRDGSDAFHLHEDLTPASSKDENERSLRLGASEKTDRGGHRRRVRPDG